MTCPACGHENPTGARFCNACGTRLGAVPAAPAPSTPPRNARAYTPPHLAEKILSHRSALEGERKQVTVLFADVKGSMDLAAQVDPEEWHRILDGFFAIMAEGVHRFEGTINQFTGDGIMALFGAPIAHEDHAQRACHAALHLTDALAAYARELRRTRGLPFSVRMGLNSGEVVVGRIGDDLRMDYTAQGHTVGMAARMEQLAEPGRVYLSEQTAELVAGWFRLEDLGLHTVQGMREPTRVYALEGVGMHRTRLDVSRARGFSRFVGRERESAVLEEALERAIGGEAQLVGVVAEPGVGKSRLCWEFLQRCRARGLTVHEAHAVPHGKTVPFLVALELARAYFGVTAEDTDKAARKKIAGTLVLIDEQLRESLPLVFEFLGVPDPERPAPRLEPDVRQRQLAAIMKRLVHEQSEREPIVTLVEDLHWIDGGSEAFLRNLVDALPGTRMLVLVTFRPEYRASWGTGACCRELALAPLDRSAMTAMLQELLGTDPSLDGLAEHIAERTGGNPFFIEEVVRALVEGERLAGERGAHRLVGPVEEIIIPPTVQAVLAARIDRLPEREKTVLQTAAVIGRKFAEPVLRRVLEVPEAELAVALQALEEAEFVQEQGASLVGKRAFAYGFTHPLTQEVAYRSQLAERRARTHAAAARVIIELYPDKLDERAALLAHHWEGAGERLEAARWSRRAADWVGVSDFPEGLRHWRKVRELLDGVPPSDEVSALRLVALGNILNFGVRVGASEEDKEAALAELNALRAGVDDPVMHIRVMAGPAALRLMAGEVAGAVEQLEEARRLAEATGDAGLRIALRAMLVLAYFTVGRFRDGLALAERAYAESPGDVRLGSEIFGFSPHILLLQLRGIMRREVGRLGEAARDLTTAAELAQKHGELELLGSSHQSHTFLCFNLGDAEGALAHARRSLEVAETIDSPYSRTQALEALGIAHLMREEWDEAVASSSRALEIARESGTGLPDEGFYLANLALALAGRGDAGPARERAEEAIAAAKRRSTAWAECYACWALARVLLALGDDLQAAEAALARSLTLLEQTGARVMEPLIRLERAELARQRGDIPSWRHELGQAAALFTEFGATARAATIAARLAA
jgi:class 3 adenylate cyclase/tetratricopeptide (TPR) repeat protein